MRTYAEAQALVGTSELVGYAGGRSRYVTFTDAGEGRVEARMFDTAVVTFTPDGVEIRTGGYVTPSTFDGIAGALNLGRIAAGTVKRVPYVLGHRMTEGMLLDYDGLQVRAGENETPLSAPRARVARR